MYYVEKKTTRFATYFVSKHSLNELKQDYNKQLDLLFSTKFPCIPSYVVRVSMQSNKTDNPFHVCSILYQFFKLGMAR